MITKLDNGKFSVQFGGLTVFFDTKYQASKFLDANKTLLEQAKKPKKAKKIVQSIDYSDKNYSLIQFSANSKLSVDRSFATVSGSHKTCPSTCAFIKNQHGSNGCYGDNGNIAIHFNAIGVKKGISLNELKDKLNCLPIGQKIRFFDVGDVSNKNGIMDWQLLNAFSLIAHKRSYKIIQFTHNVINYSNVEIAKKLHYVLNFSCETIPQAKKAIDSGVNAVLVAPSNTEKVKSRHVDGLNLVTCPAQWIDLKLSKKEITCSTCMLCSKDRVKQKNVVVFYSHGSGYKKIDNALSLINSKG